MNQDTILELENAATTVAMLSLDMVEGAKSGHPGAPMGLAEIAVTLWLRHLRYSAADPKWIARDRFVLSNGHASALHYALLHLAGYPTMTLEALKKFRQLGSPTPGHPEVNKVPGIECTTGPLGQGFANSVAMALAQRQFAARYNVSDYPIFDGRVYCVAGDGCLMEGITGEAASLAGTQALGNLVVIYDDNQITIDGATEQTFTENVPGVFESRGWHVASVDGHDVREIDSALCQAKAVTDRPSLICARTIIGRRSPNTAGTAKCHGAALGPEEVAATKTAVAWPDQPFYVPKEVRDLFAVRNKELVKDFDNWQEMHSAWCQQHQPKAAQLELQLNGEVSEDVFSQLLEAIPTGDKPTATRKYSAAALDVLIRYPFMVGGSADLACSNGTPLDSELIIGAQNPGGSILHFGVREAAMGAIANGFAVHGGFIPFTATFLVFFDYMKPAIRLAAISEIRVLFVFTHDSLGVGEDGPTHQPVEQLMELRNIPNLWVMRPANALEAAVCFRMAANRVAGPSSLVFTRQAVAPVLPDGVGAETIAEGAYVVSGSPLGSEDPDLTIVATGSEVPLAIEIAEGIQDVGSVRVVSMPCYEKAAENGPAFIRALVSETAKVVSIEAGITKGWGDMLAVGDDRLLKIGVDQFGVSAPGDEVFKQFGFTSEAIEAKIRERFYPETSSS